MKTITTLVIILLEYTAIIRLNYTLEHIIHTSTLHCNFIILTYLLTYLLIVSLNSAGCSTLQWARG